jgi:peptidoglycan/xylan/chitin deacetylase (PgdA/CDA1 family)
MFVKRAAFGLIRQFHFLFADRGLPSKVALYLHSIEPQHHAAFEAMVRGFKEAGYRFCGPADYVAAKDKVVFASFDDNYEAWYDALPFFDQLKERFTFYVNTLPLADRADGATISDYFSRLRHTGEWKPLSSDQLRFIHRAGHVIGTHSHSHFDLASLPFDQAVEEIRVGRAGLEEITGAPVRHLSFPFGMRRHFSDHLRAWCRENGFLTVSNAVPGGLHAPTDPFNLHRTLWDFGRAHEMNERILRVDGRLFERWTGKSAVG